MKVIEATIKADGQVVLDKPLHLPYSCRAVITIIDTNNVAETALLSEQALIEDWSRPEENEVWSHLQPDM